MENEGKKNDKPIDEDFLMAMMAGGEKQKVPLPESENEKGEVQQVKPIKGRSKKNGETDYEKLFFKTSGTVARNGKSVYIRPEYHERLSRIVQVIAEDKLSIYAYLDNVLDHHFMEFGEQITASFNEKYKPIL